MGQPMALPSGAGARVCWTYAHELMAGAHGEVRGKNLEPSLKAEVRRAPAARHGPVSAQEARLSLRRLGVEVGREGRPAVMQLIATTLTPTHP